MLYSQEFFVLYHEYQNRHFLELKYDGIVPRLRVVSLQNFKYKRSTQKEIALSILALRSVSMNMLFIK